MKYKFSFILLVYISITFAQSPKSIDHEGLLSLLNNHDSDTVYIMNFWATWCSPCVAEIEYFEELHLSFIDKKAKVLLINLDFPNQVEKRVIPFIREKNLTSRVYNMTDLDYNSWISDVDKAWTGSIPATLIYRKDERIFYEREITKNELFSTVNELMNNE